MSLSKLHKSFVVPPVTERCRCSFNIHRLYHRSVSSNINQFNLFDFCHAVMLMLFSIDARKHLFFFSLQTSLVRAKSNHRWFRQIFLYVDNLNGILFLCSSDFYSKELFVCIGWCVFVCRRITHWPAQPFCFSAAIEHIYFHSNKLSCASHSTAYIYIFIFHEYRQRPLPRAINKAENNVAVLWIAYGIQSNALWIIFIVCPMPI